MRISHEAIYQALYVKGRGGLKRELVACLRTGRALRVPRARTRRRGKKFVTPEIMISQRPSEADDRQVAGHWEGDLILGLHSSAIGTLVEMEHPIHDAVTPPTHAGSPKTAADQERFRSSLLVHCVLVVMSRCSSIVPDDGKCDRYE